MFGVADRSSETERVVICGDSETDPATRAALQARALQTATDIAGTPPDEVILAPPRTVPKTSSGKIRRSAAKALYETGRIEAGRRPPWLQLLRLSLARAYLQFIRLAGVLHRMLYAGWWWIVMPLGLAVAWLAVMALPRPKWRWRAIRCTARAALTAIGRPGRRQRARPFACR